MRSEALPDRWHGLLVRLRCIAQPQIVCKALPGGQAGGHRAGVTESGRRLVIRACDHTSAREVPPDPDKVN
jgi:hypothetical protein